MNTDEYKSKLQYLMSSSFFEPTSKNPINAISRLVTKTIKSSSLDLLVQKRLIPHNPQP